MTRFALLQLFFLALPFAAFFLWRALTPRAADRRGPAPADVLLLIGAVLAVGALVYINLSRPAPEEPRGRVWVPAYISVEGDLIPGFFVAAGEFSTREAARAERGGSRWTVAPARLRPAAS